MRIQYVHLISFLFVFLSSDILASVTGDSRGNGGDIIICKEDGITKYEAFDYYELKNIYQFKPKIFANDYGIESSLERMLQRLSKSGEHRAELYQKRVKNFFDEVIFVDQELEDIRDTGEIETPTQCELRQVINQNPRILSRGKYYVINKPLWEMIDNDSKVALIFHEIIYRELNHKTSDRVRKFNAFLLADKLQDFDELSYLEFLKEIGFQYGSFQGVSVTLNQPMSFYPNGNLLSAHVENGSRFQWGGNNYYLQKGKIHFHQNGVVRKFCPISSTPFKEDLLGISGICIPSADPLDESGYISLYENGQLASFYSMDDIQKDNWFISIGKSSQFAHYFGRITFYRNGSIKTVSDSSGEIFIYDQKVLMGNQDILFHENGILKSMSALTVFDVVYGESVIKLHDQIEFNLFGKVKTGISAIRQTLKKNSKEIQFEIGDEIEL